MHPVLLIPKLQGLEKSIYETLSTRGSKGLSQAKIMSLLNLPQSNQSTVSRALTRLAVAGLVAKSGSTRDAAFSLTPEAQWFSVVGHLRPPVQYDATRFQRYDPIRSPWLDEDARELMESAAGNGSVTLDPSTYTREIAERFMIEMSWASSALEGNTYSLLETEALIKYAETAGGKSELEVQMILNHKQAIGWVLDNIDNVEVTPETTMRLHAMLMRGLVRQDKLGAIRNEPASISTSSYIPAPDRADLRAGLGELCWKVSRADRAFEASFALLVGTAYLQPFIDGNKRTGRLLCNIPLLKAGLPPISFLGVGRAEYGIGMTTWYELEDPSYLNKAISEGYALSAPSYIVASATKRVPRSVEIRVRHRFDTAIGDYLRSVIGEGNQSPEEFVRTAFSDIEPEDLEIIVAAFEEVISGIDDVNCAAYGVDPALVRKYQNYVAAAPGVRR